MSRKIRIFTYPYISRIVVYGVTLRWNEHDKIKRESERRPKYHGEAGR